MGVQFDEENTTKSITQYNYRERPSKISHLLIKMGAAKDVPSAQKLLAWITIIIFVFSAYIFAVYVFGFSLIQPKSIDYKNITPEQKALLPLPVQKEIEFQQESK